MCTIQLFVFTRTTVNGSGTGHRLCPKPEVPYEGIVSLSIFPGTDDDNLDDVIETLWKFITAYAIASQAAAFATAC